MGTAKGLAKLGKTGAMVHARNKAGIRQAPLSIGGDDTGRPRPAAFYMLAHVVSKDPGKTWIAPFTQDGQSEVYINGQRLVPEKRIDKWGGTGAYFNITGGLNRVEIYQTAGGTGPFLSKGKKAGLMYLTWRTPNASMSELGGVRSKKVPMTGTSRMETRILRNSEIARSGECRLEGGITRSGGPIACITASPDLTYWFEGENPLLIYDVKALKAGHPGDTQYLWEFPDGGKVTRDSARWLVNGFRENRVVLTAKSSKGTTRSLHQFFGFGTKVTSLSNADHREAYRAALLEMVNAYPESPDPLENWSSAHWNNLVRTLDLGQGFDLLQHLFTKRLQTVSEKLSANQLSTMQDILLDMAVRREPKEAMALLNTMTIPGARGGRHDQLVARKAEMYMYYAQDLEAAKRGLAKYAKEGVGEIVEVAKIKLGDVAFLSGNLNAATKMYADVQNEARKRRNQPGSISTLVTEDLLDPKTKKPEVAPGGLEERGTDWKTSALREVSFSENVETLLASQFYLEAQQALRAWEREFPLSKITGDFIIRESELYMKLKDWKRARPMLEAYCREIDASSFLPKAAQMLIACAEGGKLPPSEIREVIEKVSERLEFHPVGKELKDYLETTN